MEKKMVQKAIFFPFHFHSQKKNIIPLYAACLYFIIINDVFNTYSTTAETIQTTNIGTQRRAYDRTDRATHTHTQCWMCPFIACDGV